MRVLLVFALVMAPGIGVAQDRDATLADMRLQLRALSGLVAGLRAELDPSGTEPAQISGSLLDRLDGMESELRRLTARTEELEFRIDRIVRDGTNRIGDLEFRLLELEGGDLGSVGQPQALGGDAPLGPLVMVPPVPEPELAVGERADFEAAQAFFDNGDPSKALAALDVFLDTYPRSPLAAAAHLARGQSMTALGRKSDAGRAYLSAFTEAETSDPRVASASLLGLGQTLSDLGQTREACLALGQIGPRYPRQPAASAADLLLAELTCP